MSDSGATCLIHIGIYKTGTTAIQRFLALNRSSFASNGVFFPVSGCDNGPEYVSHHQLVYEIAGSDAFKPHGGGLAALTAELRGCGARITCLSSENIAALWDYPGGLVRLRDAVAAAGYTPKIVCYLRSQAAYARSMYAQITSHGGYRHSFAAYLRETLDHGRYFSPAGHGLPLDYGRMLDAFAAVFGRGAIDVRRYRARGGDHSLLRDFAAVLVPEIASHELTMPAERENFSSDFASVLRCLDLPVPDGERVTFAPLALRDLWRVRRRFHGANAQLAERYGVTLATVELRDIILALPLRRTWRATRDVRVYRRALRRFDFGRTGRSATR